MGERPGLAEELSVLCAGAYGYVPALRVVQFHPVAVFQRVVPVLALQGGDDANRGGPERVRLDGRRILAGRNQQKGDDGDHRSGGGPEAALEVVDPDSPLGRDREGAAQGDAAVTPDASDLFVGLGYLGISVVHLIHRRSSFPPE